MPPASASERSGELLAGRGLRATRQRVAILALLLETPGHPSALDVHRRLAPEHPTLSQKTVYEVLDVLERAGLVSRVTHVGGPTRFEAAGERHYHAHCRHCGRLFDVPATAAGAIRGRSALPEGFRVEQIHVTLEGRCLRCADEI